MLIKSVTQSVALVCCLSANTLLAGAHTEQIVQTPDKMSVKKVETFFKSNLDLDAMIWLPLEQGTTRLGLNIPRRGFERALEFHDGHALFHLSSVTDFGFNLQQSKKFSIGLNLGSNGYLMEVKRDINNGLVGGLSVEYVDELNFVGFFDKSLVYNNTILSSRIGYGFDSTGYISGQAVQLGLSEDSEVFGWTNFLTENDDNTFGFAEETILHEMLHTLGAPSKCGNNLDKSGFHVLDNKNDILNKISGNKFLDYNKDDYYNHNIINCRDLKDSKYLVVKNKK